MPFTLAHPIAILPIWRGSSNRLHLPGLIIGAMVPDWEYFITLQPAGTIGHTPMGILAQGIPVSIGLWAIVCYGLATPFLALIPLPNVDRLLLRQKVNFWRRDRLINLVISIAIGALTHISWDSFTHPTGWFVINLPILQTKIGSLQIYKLLQYGGGILGLLGLSIWFLVWLQQSKQQVEEPIDSVTLNFRDRIIAWTMVLSISATFAIIAVIRHAHPEDGLSSIVVRAAVGSISGLFMGFVVYSIGFWSIFRKLV
jgi:Domain of unknown function (DUF4184)